MGMALFKDGGRVGRTRPLQALACTLLAVGTIVGVVWKQEASVRKVDLLGRGEIVTGHTIRDDDPLSARAFTRLARVAGWRVMQGLAGGVREEFTSFRGARRAAGSEWESTEGMPTMKQIRQERQFERLEERENAGEPVVARRDSVECG